MVYLPDVDTFHRLSQQALMVPVFRELPADLETPVSVFLKLGREAPCFLLDSVEGGEHLGRYSFIGANPYLITQAWENEGIVYRNREICKIPLDISPPGSDPLRLVQKLLAERQVAKIEGLPAFSGGAVGYFGYDIVRFFEELPPCRYDELKLPLAVFLFTDTLVIFDHVQHQVKVISNASDSGSTSAYQEAKDKIDAIILALNRPLPQPQICSTTKPTTLVSNFTPQQFADRVI